MTRPSVAGPGGPGDAPARLTGVVWDPAYKHHRPGPGHPESPRRGDAVIDGIAAHVPREQILWLDSRHASERDVMLCHEPAYVNLAREEIAAGRPTLSTGDTDVSEESFETALLAVGGAMEGVDAVMDGRVRNAFCVVRPPGHHAGPDRGMGFCIFNNAAIAARHAQAAHGVSRVLLVDWDVHHGNGTQEIFYDDGTVLYFSTHQWPFYPGTGRAAERGHGAGAGHTVNCPLSRGSTGRDVVDAFEEQLMPAARAFKPEFVVVSAGFDAAEGDPIGQCFLTSEDFSELTRLVMRIAAEFADERIVSVLEGGYHLAGLAAAAGAHVKALTGS